MNVRYDIGVAVEGNIKVIYIYIYYISDKNNEYIYIYIISTTKI